MHDNAIKTLANEYQNAMANIFHLKLQTEHGYFTSLPFKIGIRMTKLILI